MAAEEPDRRTAAWPSFLRGSTPEEVFAHLSQGDPLRLQERTARRLREVWVLLEPDRVYRYALAVCATAAPAEEPAADLEAWALAKIDRAIDQLVRSDIEAERTRPDMLTDEEQNFPLLTDSLYVDPGRVRAVAVAFNRLEPLPRRAFFELLVEGRDVVACIEGGPWDMDGLYLAIHTALAVFNLDLPLAPASPPAGGNPQP
jgi:hypothetical protein